MLMQQEWVIVFYKMLCISENNCSTELKFGSICSRLNSLSYRYCGYRPTLKNPTGLQSENFIFVFTFLSE
jgi:hypothetical protein